MGIVVAGALWAYVPALRAEGIFWCAVNAESALCDPNLNPIGHAIAIPGVADFLRFVSGPPRRFVERLGAGTGHFTGVVEKWDDTDIAFDVDMTFSGRLDSGDEGYPPPGSPVALLNGLLC